MSDSHQQIEELKQLVRRNIELSTETNKLVQGMHRSQRRASIFRVLRIAVIVALAVALYLYLSPYIEQIREMYANIAKFVPGL